MSQAHKTSFLITLSLIFLLPIFFIPGGALSLESAKAALLIFGILAAALIFMLELWREKKFSFPKHYFLAVAAALPLVYLLSALLSTPTSLSLFGYSFEVGTFGYMLLGSLALILATLVFSNTSRTLQVLTAFFLSLSLVALFAAIKVLVGPSTLLGVNNMANPVGNWTDLAYAMGLLSVFTALTIGMIPMRLSARLLLYFVFCLSTALLIVINFQTALIFTLSAAILLSLYFLNVESDMSLEEKTDSRGVWAKPVFLPALLALITLILLINPGISEKRGKLSDVVAQTFDIQNTEVSPSFSATLGISKAVLSQGALLGSGPNTFSHDWLIYKPANVNATPFWSVAFPFGAGFIPTQIASTGILGTALWLAFFALLVLLAIQALGRIPESRPERFVLIASLTGALFLWAGSFLYAPSSAILMLAFIFSGLFVASLAQTGVITSRTVHLKDSSQYRLTSAVLLSVLAIALVLVGWTGFNKTVAAYHWKKAIDLSNTAGISLAMVENELIKAVAAAPADIHYVALSRLNFTLAQAAASATSSPEENRTVFQTAIGRSIEAARLAVNLNPAGYQNWVALGTVYSSLVPKPLSVEGAYENAQFAFGEALKRNPNNPELYLLLAQLELNIEERDSARSFIRNAIALKEDYADAYLALASLEIQAGNAQAAIASAERLAALVPNSPGLYFELGVLKYESGDYAGAERALNQALVLSPEYANARYYLGLTLSRLGRLAEAQSELENLERTNPDNAELKTALEALRQGKKIPTTQ